MFPEGLGSIYYLMELIFLPSSSTHQLLVFPPFTKATHQERKGESPWAPVWGGKMPTIMLLLGTVVLLRLSEKVFPVGGPLWQPVPARLRIIPPQGPDYRIITNERADVIYMFGFQRASNIVNLLIQPCSCLQLTSHLFHERTSMVRW